MARSGMDRAGSYPRPKGASHEPYAWLAVLGLTLLCVLAFAPACGNGFVFWDDNAYFQTNQDFRGFGPAQIGWAWRTKLLDVYQPLGWMLNEAEYVCWKLDPRGYHISSLVLHIANVLLLLLLSVRLVSVRLPDLARQHPTALTACAVLAVALFAVHPLRVEAVAWAACQTYLPCITCYLLSLLAYVRYRTASPYRHWLVLAWTLFVAAFLFKAAAVTLPFVVWLLDRLVLPPRPEGRRSVRGERLLFFVPAAVFMAVTVWRAIAGYRSRRTEPSCASRSPVPACGSTGSSRRCPLTSRTCTTFRKNCRRRTWRIRPASSDSWPWPSCSFCGAGAGRWRGRRSWPTSCSSAQARGWCALGRRCSPTGIAICR